MMTALVSQGKPKEVEEEAGVEEEVGEEAEEGARAPQLTAPSLCKKPEKPELHS